MYCSAMAVAATRRWRTGEEARQRSRPTRREGGAGTLAAASLVGHAVALSAMNRRLRASVLQRMLLDQETQGQTNHGQRAGTEVEDAQRNGIRLLRRKPLCRRQMAHNVDVFANRLYGLCEARRECKSDTGV